LTTLKFLVDESTGSAVASYLRAAGYDVLSAAESMSQAIDELVLDKAVEEQRILITNDKDFGELVFRSGKKFFGVILLRLRDESSENRVRVTKAVLKNFSDRIKGNFLVASEKRVRIRGIKRV
jgi:predicted nuclease of predicted toxin-antitoxin system